VSEEKHIVGMFGSDCSKCSIDRAKSKLKKVLKEKGVIR